MAPPDTCQPENPLDVLPSRGRFAAESIALGLVPWLLVCAIEWAAIYLALLSRNGLVLVYLFFGELLLLAPAMGYAAQIQIIRTFENIFRQIPFPELVSTRITPGEVIEWLEARSRRESSRGHKASLVLGLVPVMTASTSLASDPSWQVALIAGIPFFIVRLVALGHARLGALGGMATLFRHKDYIRSRVSGLWFVLREWGFRILPAILCVLITMINVALSGFLVLGLIWIIAFGFNRTTVLPPRLREEAVRGLTGEWSED